MRRAPPGRRRRQSLTWWLSVVLTVPAIAWSQSSVPGGEFVYRARARDTLIGIARRLLLEPRRWPELQDRNHIANPRRIPLGEEVRIPYAWLRLSPDTATITALSGDVREGARSVSPGDSVAEGSQIQTGSDGSVTLLLADGSVITLQKSTVLSMEEMRRVTGVPAAHDTRLKLQSGRVQTVVKPHADVGRFEIQTPVAVSAVRGTQFRNAFDPQAASSIAETLEGTVAVSGSTAVVSVPADFGTRVERDSAPLPPRHLLPPPDLQGLAGTHGSGRLHLQWPAVAGAAAYRIQLSPEAEFQAFLLDTESPQADVDLPAPADGSYWLRVRSIDDLGLEGQDAVRAIVQHRLPAAPTLNSPSPGALAVGDGVAFAWSGVGSGVRYRVQIARDTSFTEPLFEREPGEAEQVELDHVPPGHYFWRVAGINDRGEVGSWSPAQEYIQRQEAPTPEAPAFVAHHQMQLLWAAQSGLRYRVQVARDPQFNSTLLDRTVDEPGVSMRRPRPGTYYARVQTLDSEGNAAPFGEARKFEVPVPRWLKIVLPLLTLLTLVR